MCSQIFTLKQIGEKSRFIDLEKAYDRVSREALFQALGMYDMEDKHLSGIKSMYVDSSSCVRVKGVESEWFKKDSG